MTRYIERLAVVATLAVAAVCSLQGALAGKVSVDVGRSNAPIFTTKEKFIFLLKTDFGELWKHRAPPNTEVPDEIKDFEMPGSLSWTDKAGKHELPVDVHLRGNTSQSEAQCPFPKMTLTFKKDRDGERVSKGTLFDGLKTVGIGTHCGGKPGSSVRFHRVWGGLSPHREALVYKVQALLSISGFEAAPASFSYIDSKTGKGPMEPRPSGFIVERSMPGFFLEDIKTFVKYADGKEIRAADASLKDSDKAYIFTSVVNAQKDAAAAGSTIEPIHPKAVIRILLFQSLVGNYDWHLRINPDDIPDSQGLWNIKVVETDGNWIIFPYDYDLSGWVKSADGSPEMPDLAPRFFKPDDVAKVVAEFREKRPAIEALVDELASEDRAGAQSMKRQIDSFYKELNKKFH
ncbi:MAG TPA: hypothetical protein VFI43_07990 [Nitrosospira sp.]|nr:hypothetical protein [Nitrosospira sp.]